MLRQDGQGRIWVSTNKGLLSLKPTRLGCSDERLFTHRPGIRVEYVFDAVTLADHSLWAVLLEAGVHESWNLPSKDVILRPQVANNTPLIP
jgi:hypothetical protein